MLMGMRSAGLATEAEIPLVSAMAPAWLWPVAERLTDPKLVF